MSAQDPKQAMEFVKKAENSGTPVVSSKNSGYGNAAKRRMQTIQQSRKESDQEIMSRQNKKIGY